MESKKTDLQPKKLSIMLLILAIIWVLCFVAEKQLPSRHQIEFYQRLGTQDISLEDIEIARKLLLNPNYLENKKQKHKLKQISEKLICTIVTPSKVFSIETIDSIKRQKYSNYKILIFMQNGYDKQIKKQAKDQKIVWIDNNGPLLKNMVQHIKANCPSQSIIARITMQDVLLGTEERVSIVWTQSLNSNGELGLSYSYPKDIVNRNQYRKYHLMVNNLHTFYAGLFFKINESDLRNSKNQYYDKGIELAYLLPILQMSKEHAFYFPIITYSEKHSEQFSIHKEQSTSQQKLIQKQIRQNKRSYSKLLN